MTTNFDSALAKAMIRKALRLVNNAYPTGSRLVFTPQARARLTHFDGELLAAIEAGDLFAV